MISEKLKFWIAQSESWQTFIDFNLRNESMANYDFLPRNDDFYISLFGSLIELLNGDFSSEKGVSIAKGLEIFSLENKSNNFHGVDKSNNIVFAAGLYYLSDYSSSAGLLASKFNADNFQFDIDKFIWTFLARKGLEVTGYGVRLKEFLNSGDDQILNELVESIEQKKDKYLEFDPNLYCSYLLAYRILIKFKESNIWSDLLWINSKDYWMEFIKQSLVKKCPVWDFFPSQRTAIRSGILSDEYKAISLQTPTSSGKTAICELVVYNHIKQFPGSKILYLAPYRSLASELKKSFSSNLKSLGVRVKAMYGGDMPTLEERSSIENIDILISTPEKFMALENIDGTISNQFNLVICDEGHLLDADGQRGLSFELLLSRMKRDANKKFVFISAIVPNIENINSWLGGTTVIESKYRATDIEIAFLKKSSGFNEKRPKFELEVNPTYQIPKKYILYNFLTETDLKYQIPGKKRLLERVDDTNKSYSAIIALKALNAGSVALFAPTKGDRGIKGLVYELIEQINIKKSEQYSFMITNDLNKNILIQYFSLLFGEEYLLVQAVKSGFLYHHGDLPQYVRELIESNIRDQKIRLVVCTNTLSEGVNLPIKTIVIHATKRDPRGTVTLRDIKNLFGRAGRAGQETKGMILITNENDFEAARHVILEEEMEEVKGFLYRVISELTKMNIEITGDFIDRLDERGLQFIDVIDSALIDLLEETIDVSDFERNIELLTADTFAFHQSSEEEKVNLRNFVNLRGQKIKTLIETGEFSIIKSSNFSIRTYETLKDNIELENDLWIDTNNPCNDSWINFILNILLQDKSLSIYLLEFNQNNFREGEGLNQDRIKTIIQFWLNGKWFKEISDLIDIDVDVDTVLKIINTLLGYQIQSKIGSIVHFVEKKLAEEGKEISKVVLDFSQYLIYGVNSRLELDLIELGFSEREGILKLAQELRSIGIQYSGLLELKSNITHNKQLLLTELENKVPIIVFNEALDQKILDKTKIFWIFYKRFGSL